MSLHPSRAGRPFRVSVHLTVDHPTFREDIDFIPHDHHHMNVQKSRTEYHPSFVISCHTNNECRSFSDRHIISRRLTDFSFVQVEWTRLRSRFFFLTVLMSKTMCTLFLNRFFFFVCDEHHRLDEHFVIVIVSEFPSNPVAPNDAFTSLSYHSTSCT